MASNCRTLWGISVEYVRVNRANKDALPCGKLPVPGFKLTALTLLGAVV